MAEIEQLPLDVLRTILAFTHEKSKRYLRATSTFFFNLIKYGNFCLYFTKPSQVPAIVARLSQYLWPISLTFKKPNSFSTNDKLIHKLSRLTNLTSLDVTALTYRDEFDWSPLTLLTNLTRLSNNLPVEFIGVVPHLTEASFRGDITSDLLTRLNTQTNLEALTLFVMNEHTFDICSAISALSRLTRLNINSDWRTASDSPCISQFDRLKEFKYDGSADIIKLSSLESLTCSKSEQLADLAGCSNLTHLEINNLSLSSQRSISTLTKLTFVELNGRYNADIDETTEFLTALTNLSHFSLPRHMAAGNISNAISRLNSHTLTYLKCCIYHLDENETDLVMQRIATKTKLTSLTLEVIDQPDFNASALGSLTDLTHLTITSEETRLEGNFLEPLTNLKQLVLMTDYNLPVLPNLESFVAISVSSDNLKNLVQATNLSNLDVEYGFEDPLDYDTLVHMPLVNFACHDSDWVGITKVTALRSLSLDVAPSDEYIYGLTKLNNLTELEIHGVKSLHAAILTCLSSLQSLKIPSLDVAESVWIEYWQSKMPYLHDIKLYNGHYAKFYND